MEDMMRHAIVATLLGLSLAAPAAAQAPNVQNLLGGLLTGNQNQDQAVRDAFERGYQRGRQDEARQRSDRGSPVRGYNGRGDQGGGGYDRGPSPSYDSSPSYGR